MSGRSAARTSRNRRTTHRPGALRAEQGQVVVLLLVVLTCLLGMAALAIDVGSWYQAQRATQRIADSAALAAAQALPARSAAGTLAASYADKNGSGDITVTFDRTFAADDTVSVEARSSTPGVFARVFGIGSVGVHAKATAVTSGMQSARYVAPIVVHVGHPDLNCDVSEGKPVPCFGKATTLELLHLKESGSSDGAGSFGLINLDRASGGNVGASTLAAWVARGFDQYMDVGEYAAAPSANFNNSQFKEALKGRFGTDLLFPIYRTLKGSGSNAQYDIIGWVGFRPTSLSANGNNGTIKGAFTKVIWHGIQSSTGAGTNYGALTVRLVE